MGSKEPLSGWSAWHATSDQPLPLRDKALRRRLLARRLADLPAAVVSLAWRLPLLLGQVLPGTRHWPRRSMLVGLGCDPDVADVAAHRAALDGLGPRPLLIRVFAGRDMQNVHQRVAFCRALAPRRCWTVVLVQSPAHLHDLGHWTQFLSQVRAAFSDLAQAWIIGQATNRGKWGIVSGHDYAALVYAARRVLRGAGPILVGQALDFEPLPLWSCLAQSGAADGCAWGLYVDRRGHPDNPQWGFWPTARKIALGAALVRALPRIKRRLWISEVNWPLENQGQWAPAAGPCCVSEDDAAQFLQTYLERAAASGVVERVFVWQLIARGYGLVEPDTGRKRPAWKVVAAHLTAAVH